MFAASVYLLATLSAAAADQEAPVLISRFGSGFDECSDVEQLAAAAEKGDPKAEAQYGEMLLRGSGVPKDGPRAVRLLEKAARAGEASAAFRLGMLLDDGEGVARDRVRALAYFKAAAVGGVPEAYYNVGAAYVGAHGIKRNFPEGLAWLILARKHGVGQQSELEVRAHLETRRRPDLIEAGVARAKELERELGESSVVAQLPPAQPFAFVASSAAPEKKP